MVIQRLMFGFLLHEAPHMGDIVENEAKHARLGQIVIRPNSHLHDFSGLIARKRGKSRSLVEKVSAQRFAPFHVPGLRLPGLQFLK